MSYKGKKQYRSKPLKSVEIATIHLLAQIYEKLFFFVWNIL